MKNKQEMLDKIYEVIADKTLKFGCKIKTKLEHTKKSKDEILLYGYKVNNNIKCVNKNLKVVQIVEHTPYYNNDGTERDLCIGSERGYNIKIIGHPIYIGDVLCWIEKQQYGEWKRWEENSEFPQLITAILSTWVDKRKPIEEQLEKCIIFIYNLIK